MPDDEHFRKLERMYHEAPVADTIESDLTVRDGEAEIVVPVDESYHHALGGVHGALYFKALDDAAFFAANSLIEDYFVLTTDFDLYLERPVSTGEIRAVGEVFNDNPNQLLAGAVAYDGEGNEIARGTGSFHCSEKELTPEIGYE
ncbi:PaaI family thioesterase [Halorientalis marina]|uniref:PaaI family thioesterase n=1 Tax=Halorientalis marina TaxID=2931976 RepID=UPI001FF1A85C|nr:hotdog domain-containing protein [Halorientalis marina]